MADNADSVQFRVSLSQAHVNPVSLWSLRLDHWSLIESKCNDANDGAMKGELNLQKWAEDKSVEDLQRYAQGGTDDPYACAARIKLAKQAKNQTGQVSCP